MELLTAYNPNPLYNLKVFGTTFMSSTKEGNPPMLMKVKNPETNERSEPRS
jgi:hypothetical protein